MKKTRFPYNNTGYYISKKTNLTEFYQSFHEYKRMIELDKNNLVSFWTKKHGIRIDYNINGKIFTYSPDFLIKTTDGKTIVEEVKNFNKGLNFNEKIKAAKIYCKSKKITFIVNFRKIK